MRRVKIIGATVLLGSIMALAGSGVALAHVAVQPAQVETAAFQVFAVDVPNEKSAPVTKLRLVIPVGVKHVTPTVKPGWTIAMVKDGEGENAIVKEITWTGGSIPPGQRDDFSFSAQAPSAAATLPWKAYQTYGDGTEVAWDQPPAGSADDDESGTSGPYSETKVVNELAASQPASTQPAGSDRHSTLALSLSVAALVLSVLALTRRRKS